MSMNIASVGPDAAKQVSRAAAPAQAQRSGATSSAAETAPVKVDAMPTEPPPEVHAAMGVAAAAYDNLQASGRTLSFNIDDRSGRVRIEVHDLSGNVLFTVPPSKLLEIADGGSLT